MESVGFPPAVTLYVPAGIVVIAVMLGVREWRGYRGVSRATLFPYTRARLIRRAIGLGFLVVLALTLATLERWPPQTAAQAMRFLLVIVAELMAIGILLLIDLWALGRGGTRLPRGDEP